MQTWRVDYWRGAAVYEGMDPATAGRIGGMDRQTLGDWAHRFNEYGPSCLINCQTDRSSAKAVGGATRALRRLVEADPDAQKHAVVRWRCTDLQRVLRPSSVSMYRQLRLVGDSSGSSSQRADASHPLRAAIGLGKVNQYVVWYSQYEVWYKSLAARLPTHRQTKLTLRSMLSGHDCLRPDRNSRPGFGVQNEGVADRCNRICWPAYA